MKPQKGKIKFCFAFLVFSCINAQEINWYSMDNGGGTSSANNISVSGVIGQPDAGLQTSNNISVSGGYLPTPADDLIFENSFE